MVRVQRVGRFLRLLGSILRFLAVPGRWGLVNRKGTVRRIGGQGACIGRILRMTSHTSTPFEIDHLDFPPAAVLPPLPNHPSDLIVKKIQDEEA